MESRSHARVFMRAALLAGLAALSGLGCNSQPRQSNPPVSPAATATGSDSPANVIDVHVHTRFSGKLERSSRIPQTKEEFLAEMREAGVTGAVTIEGSDDSKDYQTDLSAQNVIRCAGIGKTVDVKRIEKGLRAGYYRCLKIYLGYVHQYASDKNYHPAYRLAEKYDVPVIFHTGDTYDTDGKLKYSDPLTVDEVAVDHRKVTFVIAHCGNPWIQSAAEVAYKNPNVYLDGSAFLIGDLKETGPEAVRKSMIEPLQFIFAYLENPAKLMYGTDWPLVRMKDYLDIFKQAIPRQHWQAVFHDNAVRVFHLDRRPGQKPVPSK